MKFSSARNVGPWAPPGARTKAWASSTLSGNARPRVRTTPSFAHSRTLRRAYHGSSANHRHEVRFGVHGSELFYFNVDGNTFVRSIHLLHHEHWHFNWHTPEGEVHVWGRWDGPGTVHGHAKLDGVHTWRFTAHVRNEVP